MNLVCDSSSLINLVNSEVLVRVLNIPNLIFSIGHITLNECQGEQKGQIETFVENGQIKLIEGNDTPSALFMDLLEQHKLGDGEAECIAFSQSLEVMACTDDKKARTVAKSIVGADRVIGSIGLLKQAVTCGLLSPDEAYMAYKKMVAAGGFLPEIQLDYFQ